MSRFYATLTATLIIFATGCCDEKGLPSALRNLYSNKASERNKALLLMSKCGDRVDKRAKYHHRCYGAPCDLRGHLL